MLMAHAREVGGRGRAEVLGQIGPLGSVTEPSALRGKTLSLYFIVAIKPYIHYTLVKPYRDRVCFLRLFGWHIFSQRRAQCLSSAVSAFCDLRVARCLTLRQTSESLSLRD
jgi:hypothetical protein